MRAALVVTGLMALMGASRRWRGSMAIPRVTSMRGASLAGQYLAEADLRGAKFDEHTLLGDVDPWSNDMILIE